MIEARDGIKKAKGYANYTMALGRDLSDDDFNKIKAEINSKLVSEFGSIPVIEMAPDMNYSSSSQKVPVAKYTIAHIKNDASPALELRVNFNPNEKDTDKIASDLAYFMEISRQIIDRFMLQTLMR